MKARRVEERLKKEIDGYKVQIGARQNEMRKLEDEIQVTVWKHRFHGIELVETKLSSVSQSFCWEAEDGSYRFFEDDEVFERWHRASGDLDKKVAYYAHKDPYVEECMAKTKEGKEKKINDNWNALCKKVKWARDIKQDASKKYTLKKKNGQIVLSTSIAFNYKGDPKKKKEVFKKLKETVPCMKEFFARHGIKLELAIKESSTDTPHSCQHNVNLHDNFDRNNSSNWSTHETLGYQISDGWRCSLFVHELAHNLGLPDAYPDPDCPSRKPIGAYDDIMNNSNSHDPEAVRFYPELIKKLLGPLCGN